MIKGNMIAHNIVYADHNSVAISASSHRTIALITEYGLSVRPSLAGGWEVAKWDCTSPYYIMKETLVEDEKLEEAVRLCVQKIEQLKY